MNIKKYLNKYNIKIILLIISVLCTFIFLYLGINEYSSLKENNTPYDYKLLINRGTDKKNRFVSLSFNNYELIFRENTYNYLLTKDVDNNYYVIRVNDLELNKINNSKKIKLNKFNYEVKGYLKKYNTSIRNKVIETYQKIDKDINRNNFTNYLSNTYLDVDGLPSTNYYIYIALLFIIVILVTVII